MIGVGSNLLVRDGGIAGVVIRLGRSFAAIDPDTGAVTVRCGAAALDVNVAEVACEAGIGGLEFLSGVPGTIGGALRMNAGSFGGEMKDVVVSAEAVGPDGTHRRFSLDELSFSYRHCEIPEGWIFTAAELIGTRAAPAQIRKRLEAIKAEREASQPIRTRTGGSTFKNPQSPNNSQSPSDAPSAWELIDRAGCRGLSRGDATVSEKHCNFLINKGAATAADLEALGEEVRRRVVEATGVVLEWEIRRIGRHLPGQMTTVDSIELSEGRS
jgi:UDP-N-acetylmuramate dehydrogenase